jgi:hypothetical protein
VPAPGRPDDPADQGEDCIDSGVNVEVGVPRLLQHESLEDRGTDSGGARRVNPCRHAAIALPAGEKTGGDLDGLVETAAGA